MLKRAVEDAQSTLKQAQQALIDVQRPYNESRLKLEIVLNKVAHAKDTIKQLDNKKVILEQSEQKVKTETQSLTELSVRCVFKTALFKPRTLLTHINPIRKSSKSAYTLFPEHLSALATQPSLP